MVMPPFDQTPDQPEAFGYKVSWFAVKTTDPGSVIDALQFGEATPANWASGMAHVYEATPSDDRWVFVSPPMKGWVLAVSHRWPYPTVEDHHEIGSRFDTLFARLMKRFDDVQFFGSHRVVDFVAWARALNGEPQRIFAFSDAGVLANLGAQSAEEARLGFANLGGLSPSDAGDRIFELAEERAAEEESLVASGLSHAEAREKVLQGGRNAMPDEDDVTDLAALWSIDPAQFAPQKYPPSLGLAVRLPGDLSQ
jgi:hypothetical protein